MKKNLTILVALVAVLVFAGDSMAFGKRCHRLRAHHNTTSCQTQPSSVQVPVNAPVQQNSVVQASYAVQQPQDWQLIFGSGVMGTPVGCPNGNCPLRR